MSLSNTFLEVVPRLYLSNWQTANNEKFYQAHNIVARLTVMNDTNPFYTGGILKHESVVPGPDGPGFEVGHIRKAVDFLETYHLKSEISVLVHGVSGWSRSVACLVAYIRKNSLILGQPNETMALEMRARMQCQNKNLPDDMVWSAMLQYLAMAK